MAEFVMECPVCGKPVRAQTGWLAKRKIHCSCGYLLHVEAERMAKESCPHCGNDVIYDRTKKQEAACPVCHAALFSATQNLKFTCPACRMALSADKHAKQFTCPQCHTTFDVQARVAKESSSGKTALISWIAENTDTFLYRHPVENFNRGSQLLVHEGQKAVLLRNGKAVAVFGPGQYLLETEELPALKDVLAAATDEDVTLNTRLYFLRTTPLSLKWGVPEIRLRDAGMQFYVEFGVSGSCDLQLTAGDDALVRLVQKLSVNTVDGESYTTAALSALLRDVITARVSTGLATVMRENSIPVLDLESQKERLAQRLGEALNTDFAEYGLEAVPGHFLITAVRLHNRPDVEQWMRQEAGLTLAARQEAVLKSKAVAAKERVLLEEQTEAERRIIRAEGAGEEIKILAAAEAEAMRLKGYTYADETARMVGLSAAQNTVWDCSCGQKGLTSKFCPECGSKRDT